MRANTLILAIREVSKMPLSRKEESMAKERLGGASARKSIKDYFVSYH
jgi:hypothetical protein